MPGRAQAQVPGLPGPGLPVPVPGLPALTEATHDAVITEATAAALETVGITYSPVVPGMDVPEAPRPSVRLKLSVGSAALDLLTGTVHFDGGFKLTNDAAPERVVVFRSFASQLAEGKTCALVEVDGEVRERMPAFTFDLTQAAIEVNAPNLTLGQYPLTLTEEALAVIQEVFPDAALSTTEPFAEGTATALYELLGTQR